eukprot:gene12411-biopygen460
MALGAPSILSGPQAAAQDRLPAENFLDIAFGPPATSRRPWAALEDPTEVHEDPHEIRGDASGTPRDPPATPTSPWAAQGKEIQAILQADAAGENFLDVALGALARRGGSLSDAAPLDETSRARPPETQAMQQPDAAPCKNLDGALDAPVTPPRPRKIASSARASHVKETQAIQQADAAPHRNLVVAPAPPAAPRRPRVAQEQQFSSRPQLRTEASYSPRKSERTIRQ